ncbi:hypothetical protein ACS0TY_016622 [Phlomoides rotata]
MSGGKKKHYNLNTVSVKLGCSSSCTRPKLSGLFGRRSPRHHHRSSSSSTTTTTFSSSSTTTTTTTTTTPPADSDIKSLGAVQGFGRIGGDSVAVEKDSDDPYLDFRRSMLQMILEKELYSKDDLKQLLNCFLQLNSPYYHGIIIRAFTEIWNGVYSLGPSASSQHACN